MIKAVFFSALFLWIYSADCSKNLTQILNNDELVDFGNEFIKDLISASDPNQNFIFIGTEFSYDCKEFPCEKYNLENINQSLQSRGRLYKQTTTIDENKNHPELEFLKIMNSGSSGNDVIICKFPEVTEETLNTLEYIRRYNMKSYIMILVDNEDGFLVLKNYILKSELYNIYLALGSANMQVYLIYEVCAYCDKGKSQMTFYNGWAWQRGFLTHFKYASSYKGQFFGGELRIGTKVDPPFTFPIGRAPDGSFVYAGFEYLYIKMLAESMNFKIVIVQPSDGTSCIYSRKLRDVTGFCGDLYRKDVDIAGFPSAITYAKNQFIDTAAPYYIAYRHLTSANPELKENTSFAINASFLIAILVLYMIFAVLTLVTELVKGGVSLNRYINIPFQIFSILCLEAAQFRNPRLSQQILVGLMIVASFFMISNLFGEMTSVAAVKKPVSNYINSVEDMKEYDISWIQSPLYVIDELLKQKLPEQLGRSKIMPVVEGLKFIYETSSSSYVYIYPKEGIIGLIRLYFWDGKGQNPFHISPPLLGDSPFLISLLVRKDCPFSKAITMKQFQIEQSGIYLQKYHPETIDMIARSNQGNNAPKAVKDADDGSMVTWKSVSNYFYFCLYVLMFSITVFIIEFCIEKIIRCTVPNNLVPKAW